MPVKKRSVEQIIAKLREIEKLTAQGISVPMAARKVGNHRSDLLSLADPVRRAHGPDWSGPRTAGIRPRMWST